MDSGKNGKSIWEEGRFEDISSDSRRRPASRQGTPTGNFDPSRFDFELFSERRPSRQPVPRQSTQGGRPERKEGPRERNGPARPPKRGPSPQWEVPEWETPPRDRARRTSRDRQPAPRPGRRPPPPDNPRKRQKKPMSRGARRALVTCMVLFMAVVTVLLAIFLLFKVTDIQVTGNAADVYPSEEIVAASGYRVGDNLVFLLTRSKEEMLKRQFPYLEDVEILRRFPNTLEIRLTRAQAAACVENGGSWLTVSASGKILEAGEQPPSGVLRVYGLQVADPQPGQTLWPEESKPSEEGGAASGSSSSASAAETASGTGQEEGKKSRAAGEAYRSILLKLQELDAAGEVDWLDLSDLSNIRLFYQGRIEFLLGSAVELEYKVQFACLQAVPRLGDAETGVLDLSNADETNKAVFTAGSVDDVRPGAAGSQPAADGDGTVSAQPTPDPSAQPAPDPTATPRDEGIPDTPYTGE